MKTFVKLNLDTRVEAATTSKNCPKPRSAPYHLQLCTLHPQEYLYFTRTRNSTSDIAQNEISNRPQAATTYSEQQQHIY
jgi:hypothetical protein